MHADVALVVSVLFEFKQIFLTATEQTAKSACPLIHCQCVILLELFPLQMRCSGKSEVTWSPDDVSSAPDLLD